MSKPSIEVLGRASRIIYRDGGRSIEIESELLTGSPMLVVYARSIKTWNDGRAVTEMEKSAIIANVQDLLWREFGTVDVEL